MPASYQYIAQRLREIAPELARGRVVVAHLGSGASICALRDGRSIEGTRGFTALDGADDGDPSGSARSRVVLHLIAKKGLSVDAVNDMLYSNSGRAVSRIVPEPITRCVGRSEISLVI
jgi:acetate kinase